MHKVSVGWIPRLSTPFQVREHVECSRMNLEMCQVDESMFFKRLITQHETWVHHYDPETKSQSMQWKHLDSPPPKKARVQPSAGKIMLTVFWDQGKVVPGKGYDNYRSLLCFTFEEIKRSYHSQEAGQDQQRHPPPAGQHSRPQLSQRQIRSADMWL